MRTSYHISPPRQSPEPRPRAIVDALFAKVNERQDGYMAGRATFAQIEQAYDELEAELMLRWGSGGES